MAVLVINGNMQITSNGYASYFLMQATATTILRLDTSKSSLGSIDNVSVREVGQDWELQNGWSIGDDVAVFSGTASAYRQLYQENDFNNR